MASIVCAPNAGARLDVVIGLSLEGCQHRTTTREVSSRFGNLGPREGFAGSCRLGAAGNDYSRHAMLASGEHSCRAMHLPFPAPGPVYHRAAHITLSSSPEPWPSQRTAYRKARSGLALSRRAFFDSSPAPAGFLRSPQAPLHCPPTQQLPQPGKPRRTGIAICLFPLEDPRPWSAGLTISQAIEVSRS